MPASTNQPASWWLLKLMLADAVQVPFSEIKATLSVHPKKLALFSGSGRCFWLGYGSIPAKPSSWDMGEKFRYLLFEHLLANLMRNSKSREAWAANLYGNELNNHGTIQKYKS